MRALTRNEILWLEKVTRDVGVSDTKIRRRPKTIRPRTAPIGIEPIRLLHISQPVHHRAVESIAQERHGKCAFRMGIESTG